MLGLQNLVKRTDKVDGAESFLPLNEAVKKLNAIWNNEAEKLLLAGGLLQTPYAFYELA